MNRRVLALVLAVGLAGCGSGPTRSTTDDAAGGSTAAPSVTATTEALSETAGPSPERSGASGTSSPPTPLSTSTATAASQPPALRSSSPRTVTPGPTATPRTTTAPRPSPSPKATTSPAPVPGSRALSIKDFLFSPRSLTVPVGTTVRVTNLDGALHDWTSDTRVWASGDLGRNESFSFRFNVPGTFTYMCVRHGGDMTGSVTVTP